MENFSDSLRRRIAEINPLDLVARAAEAGVDFKAPPNETAGPGDYYHDLNGVNQPVNMLFKQVLWWTLGGFGFLMLAIRIGTLVWAKLRHVVAMSEPRDKQGYWKISQWSWMPSLKKHMVYAPLFYKRHNREFRLSSAMNVGTLPSRFHSIIIFIYTGSNIAYMLAVDWNQENKYALAAELRGRGGTLAMVNMIPLTIFAGRNNPLISLLQISFDTYNLLHRWLGRLTVLEVVVHAIAWCIPAIADLGASGMVKESLAKPFYWSGWIGTFAMLILTLTALSPFRHAFYETFLNMHIIMAFIAFVMTWIHCINSNLGAPLPQYPWIIAIFAIWGLDRFARFIRLGYSNWSRKGFTYATCEPMPGNVTRVTMHLPRYVNIRPGTHAYLRFFGIRCWESHPFSVAWVQHSNGSDSLPVSEKDPLAQINRSDATTAVSFLVGAQTGMTRRLYETALRQSGEGGRMTVKAAMEGPYAGHHSLDSYGHAVLFAGSTGITHQLSYLRHLLNGYNAGTVATRRLTLVWIIRDFGALEWVRPYMDQVLRMPNRKDILRIQIFVTRPQNQKDVSSVSQTVRMFPGRPNIPLLLVKEIQEQVGAMCVTVCGPGALADDVRGAVRSVQGDSVVDFVEESFTW